MARLGRNMAEQAMVDGFRIGGIENSCGSACHKTVDDDRNFLHARRQNCTGHGCDFTTAETAQHFQRVL